MTMKRISFFALLLMLAFCAPSASAQSYNGGCNQTASSPDPNPCALPLQPGGKVILFNNTQPTTGAHSQQVFMQPAPPPAASAAFIALEFAFSANPGTLNYQVEDATTDLTGNYLTIPGYGTLTSCPQSEGLAYTCRIELNPFMGRYLRVYVNTATQNAVNVTVSVSR